MQLVTCGGAIVIRWGVGLGVLRCKPMLRCNLCSLFFFWYMVLDDVKFSPPISDHGTVPQQCSEFKKEKSRKQENALLRLVVLCASNRVPAVVELLGRRSDSGPPRPTDLFASWIKRQLPLAPNVLRVRTPLVRTEVK